MKSWKAIFCTLTSALVILLTVSVASVQAQAQSPAQGPVEEQSPLICGPRDAAIAELVGDFGEQVIGRGLSNNGQAKLEVFKSETGTWTIIVTDTKGVSCVLANGQVWVATQSQTDRYVNANINTKTRN